MPREIRGQGALPPRGVGARGYGAGVVNADGAGSARSGAAYPAGVALMYLDRPVGTLTPAQIAFLLGNDAAAIERLMREDEEQAAQWSRDAWDARRGAPDPVLVARRSGRAAGLAEGCLHEAREATKDAQAKRFALQYLAEHPRPRPAYRVDEAMDRVQAAAERACRLVRLCDDACGAYPAPCERHASLLESLSKTRDIAVAAMRTEFLTAFLCAHRRDERS